PLGGPIQESLQEIRNTVKQSANLTKQLLTFARKQSVTPKIIDINENIEDILGMLRRLIGENVEIKWLPGENVGNVKIDPVQVGQILTNLCINSRDSFKDDKTAKILIETGLAVFDGKSSGRNKNFAPGEYVSISVEDNGSGIEKKILPHIFEPFFSTKGVRGVGLGLPTVYGIVKQNSGYVDVQSEIGKGSKFSIYLPRIEARAEKETKAKKENALSQGGETILLVEDDSVILKLSKILIEGMGYNVLPAASPEEAIQISENHEVEIKLLITDLIMPGMNGYELAKKLSETRPTMKKLFMSGYATDIIGKNGLIEEGTNFLPKPFALEDLAAAVRNILDSN
ncbi:MAG TPA: response regulator, partial [Victivallales bacterium]|nr:response regulator [Victivallales bacterium]